MGVEFTKDYWQKKRDSSAKGSDVGKHLTAWQSKCKAPDKFTSLQDFKDARITADGLKKALAVAKQKAAKSQSTQTLIKEYETEITKYLKKLEDVYQDQCAVFIGIRKKLLQMAHRKTVQFTELIDRAKEILAKTEEYEEQAADANEPGRQMMWRAVHEFDTEMKKIASDMAKIEGETSPEMVFLKGRNPGHYYVELDDVKEAEKYMRTATVRMNECSSFLKEMKLIQADFKASFDDVLGTIQGQRKDRGVALNRGIALRLEGEKILKEMKEMFERAVQNNVPDLREKATKPSLTQSEKDAGSIRVQDLNSRRQHMQVRVTSAAGLLKEFKRISRPFGKDPNIQESLAVIEENYNKAAGGVTNYDKVLKQAEQWLKAIESKPLAN